MKMSKLTIVTVLVAVFVIVAGAVFAAGEQEAADGADGELPEVTWKLSHTTDPQSTYQVAAVAFKEYVEEQTDGRFTIDIHHSGVLGWEREVLEAMQIGTIEATIPALGPFAVFVPSYNVFNLPFTFQGPEHMLAAYSDPVMTRLTDAAAEEGFIVGVHFLPTFRYPLYGGHPIESPDDFQGLKFRTMGVPAHIDTYKALGANVTSTAFSECYGALQMVTIDGLENYYNNLLTMKFHEQTEYVSNLPILNNAAAIVFSKVAWDQLPPEYQEVLIEAAQVGADAANEVALTGEKEALETMIDYGIEPVFVDDFAPFIEATQPVTDRYLAEMEPWVAEVREEIMALAN